MYFTKALSVAFLFVCLGLVTFGDQCVHVAGGVTTNIGVITPIRTLGTATGDLKGAIGVEIPSLPGPVEPSSSRFTTFWVTEAGDTIAVETCSIDSRSRCTRSLRGGHLPRVDTWWDGEI
jgi:hypothetical protein